jgi:beta-galactosidase
MSGFYIGACHYPEQFPSEQCEQDARLMAEANLNVVRLGELAWGLLEPARNRFDLDWMERFLDTFHRHGIRVLYGTPTACPPPWFAALDPSAMPVDERGNRCGFGSWGSVCMSSPTYLERVDAIVSTLAERFGDHPAILGWQLDNESLSNVCYCDRCRERFHKWLQDRYGSLKELNEAWDTTFWTHVYGDWGEIPSPAPPVRVHHHNPSLRLDYARFQSDLNLDLVARQAEIVRPKAPGRFLTHNVAGRATHLDYYKMADGLDVMGWDSYPVWTGKHPWGSAMGSDVTRSLKDGPFWVPEHEVGRMDQWRWDVVPAGKIRLWTYQAVARGAEGIVYFLWRAGRGGAEQYIQSIVTHDGRKTRIYDEIARTAAELRELSPQLEGSRVQADLALLHDYADHWALGIQPMGHGLDNPWYYAEEWYEAAFERNLVCDFVRKGSLNPQRHPVVVAPAMCLASSEVESHLKEYVTAGGTLIFGPRSGSKTSTNLWPEGPIPGVLADLVGAIVEEFESLPPEQDRELADDQGNSIQGCRWFEALTPTTAQTLMRYVDGVFAGQPAIVANEVGEGRVIYVGAMGTEVAMHVLSLCPSLMNSDRSGFETEIVVRQGPAGRVEFQLDHVQGEVRTSYTNP